MKRFFLFSAIIIMASACEIFDFDYDTYTILNQTDKEIVIMAYDAGLNNAPPMSTPMLFDSISIPPYGKYFRKKGRGEDYEPGGYFESHYVDSVTVTFDNVRRITYTCDKEDPYACYEYRNIMNWNHFSEERIVKNRGIDYTYTFTMEDYENADILE